MPKITVVIPTRSRPESLSRCLAALAPGTQTLDPGLFEIVISDDGDPDVTRELLRKRFPFARHVVGPRRGPGANRNCGVRESQSPFIAFIDDDCLPEPQWLSAFAEAIVDSVDLYEGKTTCRAGLHSPMQESPINLDGGRFWSCNLMVRTARFRSVGGFDEDYSSHMEDITFRDTIARTGAGRIFVPNAIVDHPPRIRATGWKLRPIHESFALFWAKNPEHRRSTMKHMLVMWKLRMGEIASYSISLDSFRAFISAILEQSLILWKMPRWQRHYRRKMAPAPTTGHADH